MKTFSKQLELYGQQHTNKINRMTHYIGIPAIVCSLLMGLSWVSLDVARVWVISFSWILVIASLIYYALLNRRLACLMFVIMMPLTWLISLVAGTAPTKTTGIICLVLFLGGWLLQFIGHLFEKKRPAFFQSAVQLLIGPLFIMVELLVALKMAQYFIKVDVPRISESIN